MLTAMWHELELRKDYLANQVVESIYFGGGTPSVLSAAELGKFIDAVAHLHAVSPQAEITVEANPDDLSAEKVYQLRQTPVNRFSIGIQSFFDEDLKWMNRAHTAMEADSAVKRVQDAGFDNITLDLIYGFPLLSDEKWRSNILKVLDLQVPHVSAYSMTVEERTALAHFIRKGTQPAMNDAQSARQFLFLTESLVNHGFEHYEISNFALPGKYSFHNTNYWKGVSYLGIGPSAHSFNGTSRQWNVANNAKYISAILKDQVPAESETLCATDRLNEYIMTSLRTMWGMDLNKIEKDFGMNYRLSVENGLHEFKEKKWIENKEGIVVLSAQGKLFADHIASQLFVGD